MATSMFIKFINPDIAGGALAPGHVGEIEVLGWSHDFGQASRGRQTVEQATHQDLSFTKYIDQASSELLRNCWSGIQFRSAVLKCYRADRAGPDVLYLTVAMEHVVISNLSISGGAGDVPVETVTLGYGLVTYHYALQAGGAAADSVSHDLIKQIVT